MLSNTASSISIANPLLDLLLVTKEERGVDWQERCAPLVADAAREFAQLNRDSEVNFDMVINARALLLVALIGFAKAVGVKEAKKRNLNFSLWETNEPIHIESSFDVPELRVAAYEALSILRQPKWICDYLRYELMNCKAESSLAGIAQWIWKNTSTPLSFLQRVSEYNCKPMFLTWSGWAEFVLKVVFKEVKKEPKTFDHEFVCVLNNAINIWKAADSSLFIGKVMLEGIEDVLNANSFILLDPQFSTPIKNIVLNVNGNKQHEKYNFLDRLCLKFVNLTAELNNFGLDNGQKTLIKDLWVLYGNMLQDKPAFIKKNQDVFKVIGWLLESDEDNAQADEEGVASMENSVIQLVTTWDEYVALSPVSPSVRNISKKINAVLTECKISDIGNPGDIVTYDPLTQYLISKSEDVVAPQLVRLRSRGFSQKRLGGSLRILKKAVVEPNE
jgi:hypothetical protein